MEKDRGWAAGQEEAESQTHTPRGLEFLIFFTGAATLSLEVLASRIMTPYFGVSLYIWAGILAITLIFLATGYYLGGRLTIGRRPQSLLTLVSAGPPHCRSGLIGRGPHVSPDLPVTGPGQFNRRQFFGRGNAPGFAPDPALGHESPAHRPGPLSPARRRLRGRPGLFHQHHRVGGRGNPHGLSHHSQFDEFSGGTGAEPRPLSGHPVDNLAGQGITPVRIDIS